MALPWKTLEDCIAVLTLRRDALTRQIEALNAPTVDREGRKRWQNIAAW